MLPCPNLRTFEPNIRYFASNNAKGIFMQGYYNGLSASFSELRNYMTSRLLWNPNLSGEGIIDEFLRLHYGVASPPIKEFINLIHDNVVKKGIQRGPFGKAENYGLDRNLAEKGLKAFEEAMQLAGDDEVLKQRIEKASITAYCMMLQDVVYYAWDNRDKLEEMTMPKDMEERTRKYVKKFFELTDKYNADVWSEGGEMRYFETLFKRAYGLKENEDF
jgi:hypothetical protein